MINFLLFLLCVVIFCVGVKLLADHFEIKGPVRQIVFLIAFLIALLAILNHLGVAGGRPVLW